MQLDWLSAKLSGEVATGGQGKHQNADQLYSSIDILASGFSYSDSLEAALVAVALFVPSGVSRALTRW